jgi:hypothetical protein
MARVPEADELDLRKPDHARRLEAALSAVKPEALTE